MDWHERIEQQPGILRGRPVVRGTRLRVELVVALLAGGWTSAGIVKRYPELTEEDIQACLRYAAERLHKEHVYPGTGAAGVTRRSLRELARLPRVERQHVLRDSSVEVDLDELGHWSAVDADVPPDDGTDADE